MNFIQTQAMNFMLNKIDTKTSNAIREMIKSNTNPLTVMKDLIKKGDITKAQFDNLKKVLPSFKTILGEIPNSELAKMESLFSEKSL